MTWYAGLNQEDREAGIGAMARFSEAVNDSVLLAIGAHQEQNADRSVEILNHARKHLTAAFEKYIEDLKAMKAV
jgi:hypothetical protein